MSELPKEPNNIQTLNFAANINLPLPTESRNTTDGMYRTWGMNNLYPNFIIDLYTQSSVHGAIINQKSNYIVGNGLQTKDGKPFEVHVNASDTLSEFVSKTVKDYLLFNAYAVEVVFNFKGEPIQYHHVPMHKIRMNFQKNKFWYCEDWMYDRKFVVYDRYIPNDNNDSTSKLFYFDGYFPSVHHSYPTPDYNGARQSIATNIAISDFNLNNIKNHFSPSTIITFYQGGNIDERVMRENQDGIERNFKGENGKKFILDYQTKDGKGAEVKQLSANDWDKAYIEISKNSIDEIMIGHQVQNPQLFGMQTAGKLGASQELEVSYEMFKSNYISVKRQELENSLNRMFTGFAGVTGQLQFADKPLFAQNLKDDVKMQIMTINELRKIQNLQPLPDGDRLLSSMAPVKLPTVHPVLPKDDTTEQKPVEQSVDDSEDLKKKSSRKLTGEDYELIKHLGQDKEQFEIIGKVKHKHHHFHFDKTSEIAQYVIDHDLKGLTPHQLVDVLGKDGIYTDVHELKSILNDISESGVADVEIDSNGSINITPSTAEDVPDTGLISTMYEYVLRDGINGAPLLSTSRSFCEKLITNNKLYSMEDIQSMSAIFNYDVKTYCGGWYYNPETDESTPYCRHDWSAVSVRKK